MHSTGIVAEADTPAGVLVRGTDTQFEALEAAGAKAECLSVGVYASSEGGALRDDRSGLFDFHKSRQQVFQMTSLAERRRER